MSDCEIATIGFKTKAVSATFFSNGKMRVSGAYSVAIKQLSDAVPDVDVKFAEYATNDISIHAAG